MENVLSVVSDAAKKGDVKAVENFFRQQIEYTARVCDERNIANRSAERARAAAEEANNHAGQLAAELAQLRAERESLMLKLGAANERILVAEQQYQDLRLELTRARCGSVVK